MGCSDEPTSVEQTPPIETKIDTVVLDRLGPFWPPMIGGDCEFRGNGPFVELKARLYLESSVIMCYIYMYAIETESNYSEAEGSWDELIYIAPTGWEIDYIGADPDSCETEYIDSNNSYDWTACPGTVFRFASLGDTDGCDIGNTTMDDTHVYVYIDTLFVELKKR
jgi:hypothetical protein